MLQQYNPKNKDIMVHVGGELLHRDQAKVSVFDSSVQGGDAVWEGLRVYNGGIFCLDKHLERLIHSARTLAFENIPKVDAIKKAIKETLHANGMTDETHIRLTLTRGEKVTSGMDPRLNQKGCTLIVLAEWKPLVYDNKAGISVITSHIRRNSPEFLDSKIHHANLLNNILAKIQANIAGVDAAVMLDDRGFVAELNDVNLFAVRGGTLYTPFANACLHGITRGLVMEIASSLGITVTEKDLSLTEFYAADEVFTSGTMGEMTPVREIDGRKVINEAGVEMLPRITKAFKSRIPEMCEPI
ncbi:MAG: aminotransferase class IV [Bacteroidota bacterium]